MLNKQHAIFQPLSFLPFPPASMVPQGLTVAVLKMQEPSGNYQMKSLLQAESFPCRYCGFLLWVSMIPPTQLHTKLSLSNFLPDQKSKFTKINWAKLYTFDFWPREERKEKKKETNKQTKPKTKKPNHTAQTTNLKPKPIHLMQTVKSIQL